MSIFPMQDELIDSLTAEIIRLEAENGRLREALQVMTEEAEEYAVHQERERCGIERFDRENRTRREQIANSRAALKGE
jgi:hypothetical protein